MARPKLALLLVVTVSVSVLTILNLKTTVLFWLAAIIVCCLAWLLLKVGQFLKLILNKRFFMAFSTMLNFTSISLLDTLALKAMFSNF